MAAAQQAPQIAKPRPAPPGPSTVLPLPTASFDNSLNIGGDDIRARKVGTRMTVDTHVNGRGPYRFVVDSGADTSVVGLRIAHDLALPLGRPAILNGTTDRSIVDRVKVDQLALGGARSPTSNCRHCANRISAAKAWSASMPWLISA